METLALFDDTIGTFTLPAVASPGRPVPASSRPVPASFRSVPPIRRGILLDGWVKTYQQTGTNPLPTLLVVNGDGNEYRPARFEMAAGVTVGQWPVSGCTGIRAPGAKELICLYEAVRQDLAWEVTG